ncbi:Fe-S cluster assembly protein SufD [Aureimonas endophytica]|uniref:Fe-S cluster assembly protein SufD n=1 Tax=Aureimonas endophytica TaxID=2027858 RepID=A0A916ZCL9_9HYPH|nr:Fe-S cluster assembly protein SufD [Aureimonas endophytica]GGD88657.1 Fe-S cluster assembly protein SufD [Aureimonas endophytica]
MSEVVSLRRMTPAEEAVIARAEAEGAEADGSRRDAIAMLRREGLPHRRIEAWHYTDLRSLVGRDGPAGSAGARDDILAPLLPGSTVVELGRPAAASAAGLSLSRSGTTPDWRQSVNHLDRAFDTIRLLATAFGASGTRIEIAPGAKLAQAVELRGETTASGERGFAECHVGDGASVTFVERLPAGGERALSTAVSNLTIGEDAEVLWIVDQERGAGETHLGQLNVAVGRNAKFRLFVLNAGGAVVRLEVHTLAVGEGAEIIMRGVNLLEAGQHVDVTTTLNHKVENTTATEIFRNVVLGGHGVFQGMIRVSKGAQKTDARMACNTLILSDEGDFSAKPELEIFADDVQCGHGATVAEIDQNHLFYLMSRGIPAAPARALLVRAFVDEVVEELEDEAVVEALEARIDAWLERER